MTTSLMMASILSCYVGSNTGSPDRQALHVLSCDPATGAAKFVQSVTGIQGTTYFQVSPDGRFLYSVVDEKRDVAHGSAAVRFPISADGRLGAMERLAALPCETPCHVSLSPDGSRMFTASYLSATVCSLKADGSDLKAYVFPDDDMGPNAKRQRKAYAHFTFTTPDGSRLGAVDLGCDRIRFFDPATLAVDPAMEIKSDRGDGPRHAVWSKDGRFLFVVNELGSSVSSYAFDGRSFAKTGKWSTLPDGFDRWEADGETLATKAAAVKLTADGAVLMASNRGHDSIAFFSVDAKTGALARRNVAKLTGRFPRDFELMPGERFMVVGHKMSDEIRVYRFDRASFSLAPVWDPIPCWRPLCFRFPAGTAGNLRVVPSAKPL